MSAERAEKEKEAREFRRARDLLRITRSWQAGDDNKELIQEALVRAVFATKIVGLSDTAILYAFLGAWPFISTSDLRVKVTWPRKAKAKTKAPPKKAKAKAKR